MRHSDKDKRFRDNLYRDSRFCLQPWGDTMSRKGFYDALLQGCINVIFAHEVTNCSFYVMLYVVLILFNMQGYNGIDSWFGDHRLLSVFVPLEVVAKGNGVLNYLRNLSKSHVLTLHDNVLRVREKLLYRLQTTHQATPHKDDAFDVILENLIQIFIDNNQTL